MRNAPADPMIAELMARVNAHEKRIRVLEARIARPKPTYGTWWTGGHERWLCLCSGAVKFHDQTDDRCSVCSAFSPASERDAPGPVAAEPLDDPLGCSPIGCWTNTGDGTWHCGCVKDSVRRSVTTRCDECELVRPPLPYDAKVPVLGNLDEAVLRKNTQACIDGGWHPVGGWHYSIDPRTVLALLDGLRACDARCSSLVKERDAIALDRATKHHPSCECLSCGIEKPSAVEKNTCLHGLSVPCAICGFCCGRHDYTVPHPAPGTAGTPVAEPTPVAPKKSGSVVYDPVTKTVTHVDAVKRVDAVKPLPPRRFEVEKMPLRIKTPPRLRAEED